MKVTFEWVDRNLCPVYCLIEFDVCETFCRIGARAHDKWSRHNLLCFYCLLMSCYCKCPVAPPHGAVGWSAVCDCGIS